MPAVTLQEKMRRKDTMVYWAAGAKNKYGEAAFAAAVEINVRWWTRAEEFVDSEGERLLSRALVYPGQSLELYSYVYNGVIADLPPADKDNPEALKDSFDILQVKHYTETPWIKYNHILYQYYLI